MEYSDNRGSDNRGSGLGAQGSGLRAHGHTGTRAHGHTGTRVQRIQRTGTQERRNAGTRPHSQPGTVGRRQLVPRVPGHSGTLTPHHGPTIAPAHQRRISRSHREPSPPLARRCIITGQPVADRQDHANVLPQDGTAGGDGFLVVSRGTSSSRLGSAEKPEGGQATDDPDDASFLARSAATEPPLTEGMAPPPNLSAQDPASTDVARWKTVLFLR